MGWNKRSSGNRYDSTSGHGVAIGSRTKKVVAVKTYSRSCVICDQEGLTPVDHECPRNHDGTPKSMEVRGIVEIFTEFWDQKKIGIKTIISDDDSTMRSQLKNRYLDLIAAGRMHERDWPRFAGRNGRLGAKKKCSGALPVHMKPPTFLADPNHRVKVFGKHLFELARASKGVSEIDTSLAQRLKEYWGKALSGIKSLDPDKDREEIIRRGKAPLDHLFDEHNNCGSWCYKKKLWNKIKNTYPQQIGLSSVVLQTTKRIAN